MSAQEELPEWATEWVCGPSRCCGSRLVRVECRCGGHIACAQSAVDFAECQPQPVEREKP